MPAKPGCYLSTDPNQVRQPVEQIVLAWEWIEKIGIVGFENWQTGAMIIAACSSLLGPSCLSHFQKQDVL
jgi:hypothetical protein